MSEQDDEQWITERLDGVGSCADDMRAAIARGYERGKAEGAADRDRLAKRLESADAMIEMYRAKCEVFRERLHAAQPEPSDRLAALEQRVGGIVETLRAKLAEAERCAQESADIMRRARDRAESYCLRLGEAESQRDALRQHALKLDGLCERAAVLLGALGRDDHQLVRAIRSRGEVPR